MNLCFCLCSQLKPLWILIKSLILYAIVADILWLRQVLLQTVYIFTKLSFIPHHIRSREKGKHVFFVSFKGSFLLCVSLFERLSVVFACSIKGKLFSLTTTAYEISYTMVFIRCQSNPMPG